MHSSDRVRGDGGQIVVVAISPGAVPDGVDAGSAVADAPTDVAPGDEPTASNDDGSAISLMADAGSDDGDAAFDAAAWPEASVLPDSGVDSDAGPATAIVDAAIDALVVADIPPECASSGDHPVLLGCTGLYSDWASRTIAAGVRAFAPGLELWSDGAEKSRWILLPPGSRIDTSSMDEWTFPVGTKVWKEFRVSGHPIETRFLWKRGVGDWFKTTYVWSADHSSAAEVTTGVPPVNGGSYEIPSQARCTTCHQGRQDVVLGFEAVSLSTADATGLTLGQLVSEGLLTNPPSAPIVVPGSVGESAALGWLHANCGTTCHNRSLRALAGSTGLFMRLEVANLSTVKGTDTWTTAVGQDSNFQPTATSNLRLIDPGIPDNSAVYFRASQRDDQGQGFQMPPIDTHVVPDAALSVVRAWIQSMPPGGA